jgi:hypothetical protein
VTVARSSYRILEIKNSKIGREYYNIMNHIYTQQFGFEARQAWQSPTRSIWLVEDFRDSLYWQKILYSFFPISSKRAIMAGNCQSWYQISILFSNLLPNFVSVYFGGGSSSPLSLNLINTALARFWGVVGLPQPRTVTPFLALSFPLSGTVTDTDWIVQE